MKKVLVILLAIVFLFTVPAVAQKAVQINFAWDQSNISPDFWGWRMYVGTVAGGPYDYLGKDANDKAIPLMVVQYDSANPTGLFTGTGNVTAPANAETPFYFVIVAYDSDGNFSDDSNEVNYTADFLGPDAPVLSITSTAVVTPP